MVGTLNKDKALVGPFSGHCETSRRSSDSSTQYPCLQVTLTSVQVSWHGLVTRGECADQFIVKSWLARNPNDYKMSDLLPTTQFSWVVKDLVPNQDYVFQVRNFKIT